MILGPSLLMVLLQPLLSAHPATSFQLVFSLSYSRLFGELVAVRKAVTNLLKLGSKAVADGRYVLTEPLTPGNYTIHYKSSLSYADPGCAEPAFAQDLIYSIIAK